MTVHLGYAASGAQLPFICIRPLTLLSDSAAISGDNFIWDDQVSAYCAGGSVEAGYNLAKALLNTLQGTRVSGEVLACSIGYVGAQVEGHYETQVTIQADQGAVV